MTTSPPTTRARTGIPLLVSVAVIAGIVAAPISPAVAVDAAPKPTPPTENSLPADPLVKTGTVWRFLDDNTDPAPSGTAAKSWTAPDFDDSAWKSGASGFGAVNNQLAAIGEVTPKTKLRQFADDHGAPNTPAFFFRTKFTLEPGQAKAAASLIGKVVHDDAAVVWVNGEKVAGFNDSGLAGKANLEFSGESVEAPATDEFAAPGSVLRDGENTIAVEIHQDKADSPDVYFDLASLSVKPADGKNSAPKTAERREALPPVGQQAERVVLNPTATPDTSQTFTWIAGADGQESGEVEIGETVGGPTRTIQAKNLGRVNGDDETHFTATVDGLKPGTTYYYRVGPPGFQSDWNRFRTADQGSKNLQFLQFGDAQIGLDTVWPSVVKLAEANAPRSSLSVHSGDLVNLGTWEPEWIAWFDGAKHLAATQNLIAAPGNHEYSGDPLLKSWKANFQFPKNQPTLATIGDLAKLADGNTPEAKQWAVYFDHWSRVAADSVYSTDYQGVRFVTLNSNRNTVFLTPANLPACDGADCPANDVGRAWQRYQAAWLDHTLKTKPTKWSVVTFHHPLYSTALERDEKSLRAEIGPVLEANNVDLVFSGHDHTYARGYKNSTATSTPGLTTGPVYTVSNSGGKYYPIAPRNNNVWTQNGATPVAWGQGVSTFQVVDISGDKLTYRSFVAAKDLFTPNPQKVGDLFDEVTITKYDGGTKWVTEPGVEAPAAPTLKLSKNKVKPGEKLTVTGANFTPDVKEKLELHSDPVALTTVTPGADRAFSVEVTIPKGTTAGAHEIQAIAPNGGIVRAAIAVAADPGGGGNNGGGNNGGGGNTGGGGNHGGANGHGGSGSGIGGDANGAGGANGRSGSANLAQTGATVLPLAITGVVLIVAGGIALVLRHRARSRRS